MNKTLFILIVFYSVQCFAQEYMSLWPEGKMPNSKGMNLQDSVVNQRIYQVGNPGMWIFLVPKEASKGGAVVIFPGGGYHHETYNLAGWQLAKWFNTFGVSAFVVKYRLPNSPDLNNRAIAPMQDAQRALRIIRANANAWNINPQKIGVMGTSAGCHVASTIGTHFEDVSAIGDSLDRYSYSANFMILVSPVIDLGTYAHIGSRENLLGKNASKDLIDKYSNQLHVTSKTPPAFLVHALNDKTVPVKNSLLFYQALVDSGVPASLHIFPQGAHSIGLRNNPGSTQLWPSLCEEWMKEMGFVEEKK